MNFRVSIAATFCSLTLLSATASAQDQPWLQDRRYTEGIGIRTGDLELHPGVAAEFGYDSNYFHRDDSESGGPVGTLRLRITPSFSLSTLGPQRQGATPGAPPPDFEFRAGIAATYDEFFPVSGPESGQDAMSDQRNVGGTLDLKLSILPRRPWSGTLEANLGRTIAPSDQGLTDSSFNRINAGAGGELIWTPGGGLFDWRLGYHFTGVIFEQYSNLTNLQNEIETRGRWRFLPRTALMYDAKFGFINYPDGVDKTSSHPVQAQLGVNGLVTSSFGVLAMAGWGASFYTPTGQNDFDSVIGQLELKWFITPNPSTDPAAASLALSSLAGGFIRDFHDSYIGTYFERDRGYLKLTYFFAGRFLVVADAGLAAIVYPPFEVNGVPSTPQGFTDLRIDASLFGEYRLKDSIGINTTIRYGNNISDGSISDPASGTVNSLAWQQFEAYLGARWFM